MPGDKCKTGLDPNSSGADTVQIVSVNAGDVINFSIQNISSANPAPVPNAVVDIDGIGGAGDPTPTPPYSLPLGGSQAASYVVSATDATDNDVSFNIGLSPSTGQNGADDLENRIRWTITCQPAPNPELTLEKTADPLTYSAVGDVISYSYDVENTGNVTLSNVAIADDKATDESCPATPTSLLPGGSISCTASYTITQADLDSGSVTNTAKATAKDPANEEVQSNEDSATVTLESNVEDEVKNTTEAFVSSRMDRILQEEPDRPRLIRKRGELAWNHKRPFEVTARGEKGNFEIDVTASAGSVMSYAAGTSKIIEPAADLVIPVEPVVRSTFDVWLEGHFSHYGDDTADADRKGDFGIIYLGADYLAAENIMIGVLAQVDWTKEESDELGSDADGTGWMIGPYFSAEITDHLFFDMRGAWGRSDNDMSDIVNGTEFEGDFDTERWLLRARLTGNWQMENLRITPSADVAYMKEHIDNFEVTDADDNVAGISDATLSLGRLTLGPEIAYRIESGEGSVVEPFGALKLMWDFHGTGNLTLNGITDERDELRGEVEAGVLLRTESGWSARASAAYDGIGSNDLEALSFRGWVNVPF